MTPSDINKQFYEAFWSPGMVEGTLTVEDYKRVEDEFKVKFPDSFIQWHKIYFFKDGDCSFIRLPNSLPEEPLEGVKSNLYYYIAEQLIPLGLVPFADEGNDTGPFVFDTRGINDTGDFPIRVYDHEYNGDLDGLSEIVFSSFTKLIECLTFYLNQLDTKKDFEIIPAFYEIDPEGAGSTGKAYWNSWVEMLKGNFELFGH